MIPADFEESEFRGPLYNQLERGNHLVWEPGQVFEKHIGIDRAAYVTDPIFWGFHGYTSPLGGVVLLDYDWDYIWRERVRNKLLPDFSLNLFLQVKRPHAGTRPRGLIRKNGITGDYWKFAITPHQQRALERMADTLCENALICYASPAFHTQAALYQHTKNLSIVSTSTFPPVTELRGHGAWYYNNGGTFGVANPDFVRVEIDPLELRIAHLVERSAGNGTDSVGSLATLASHLLRATEDIVLPSSADTWLQLQLQRVENAVRELIQSGETDETRIASMRHFGQVRAFCNVYHLDWYVIGNGSEQAGA